MTYQILPSLLAADLTRIGDEITATINAGTNFIHIDVMDNHYVPNLSFGPAFCQAVHQRFEKLSIDVHLMTKPVDALIHQSATAGAARISIHPDATIHLDRSLQLISDQGCKAGLVLNPATSPECLEWCIHHLDFVLIMSVNPGFGGQTLIPAVIKKIERTHELFPHLPICVDGGITIENIASLARAGATQFVVGSTLFNTQDYCKTIASLLKATHDE